METLTNSAVACEHMLWCGQVDLYCSPCTCEWQNVQHAHIRIPLLVDVPVRRSSQSQVFVHMHHNSTLHHSSKLGKTLAILSAVQHLSQSHNGGNTRHCSALVNWLTTVH